MPLNSLFWSPPTAVHKFDALDMAVPGLYISWFHRQTGTMYKMCTSDYVCLIVTGEKLCQNNSNSAAKSCVQKTRMWVDSFDKEPDIRRSDMKETGREDWKLQCEELGDMLQKVEEIEFQHRKKNEEWKHLQKNSRSKTMLEQNKKMDKSQHRMEHLE